MLGVFAEFETALRRERQMEGIAKAKEAGVYKGRKPSVDVAKVREPARCRDEALGNRQGAKSGPDERVAGAVRCITLNRISDRSRAP